MLWCKMMSPFCNVLNTRETYSRFLQKNIQEVEVQFMDEEPAWIPYDTLISMLSKFGINDEYTET